MFYEFLDGNYITAIGTGFGEHEITSERYYAIEEIIKNIPEAPSGYLYMLRSDNLEWELVELPPDPDPELDNAEAFDIIFGGGAE